MHFNCQEREKKEKTQTIDHRRQSNHDTYVHAAPYGRRDGCASSETSDGQISLPGSVSRATLMARASPTR